MVAKRVSDGRHTCGSLRVGWRAPVVEEDKDGIKTSSAQPLRHTAGRGHLAAAGQRLFLIRLTTG